MNIIWFKRDLRTEDQPALSTATQSGEFKCIYIFEPDLWIQPDLSGRHFNFLIDCLVSLQHQLSRLGIELSIYIDEAINVFKTLHCSIGPFKLYSCQETWNDWTFNRDKKIRNWCKANNLPWFEFTQHGVIRCLKNRDGWSQMWLRQMRQTSCPLPPKIHKDVPIHPLPTPKDFNLIIESDHQFQRGGSEKADELLHSFLTIRGHFYSTAMSSPVTAFEACSRLSPHIAFGSISIRHVFQTTLSIQSELNSLPATNDLKKWKGAIRSFLSRLRWHCHFIQKLEDDPAIEFRALHSMYRAYDQKDYSIVFLTRWKEGNTGYPLIDACMRALAKTGWLNFRMRAMVMSFAVHHLQLPWRICAIYLATQFTDYEPGIHYSQCQMQSGITGINTIRIYNPIKQSYDQDPDGLFIRSWCPDLADIPKSGIHEPWFYGAPLPIVDEAVARRKASDTLYHIRKKPQFGKEADFIQLKHGSRRKQTTHNSSNPLPLF